MAEERLAEYVAEFQPLNRRRVNGNPALSVLELQRWSELRELLEYALGHQPPIGAKERALRVPTHLKVRYGAGESGPVLNLSEGGLFVECETPLAPGSPLHLEIETGDAGAALQLDAEVAWNRELPTLDGPAGFGVAFKDLEAEEYAAVAALVDGVLGELARG